MDHTKKRTSFVIPLTIAGSLLFGSTAIAHESRTISDGAFNVVVGWDSEPAFAKSVNAFEIIFTDDIVIDDIDLDVSALYLKDDVMDPQVIFSAELTGDLRQSFSNPGQFNIWFLPTKAGAYGFHIKGMVNGTMVDEIFICRGGSQDPDGSSFACVDAPQKFPGKTTQSPPLDTLPVPQP